MKYIPASEVERLADQFEWRTERMFYLPDIAKRIRSIIASAVELPELCETVGCKNHVELPLCRACIDQMIKRNTEQRIKETRPASAVEMPEAEEDGVLEAKANYVYQRCKELTSWMADEVLPRIRALATPPVPDDKLREVVGALIRYIESGDNFATDADACRFGRAALRKEGA